MTQETGARDAIRATALAALDDRERAAFAAVADHLIPAAHGMPSAADVVDDDGCGSCSVPGPTWSSRCGPRSEPDLGDDVAARLDALGRDEPANLAALQLAIVGGYYTEAACAS